MGIFEDCIDLKINSENLTEIDNCNWATTKKTATIGLLNIKFMRYIVWRKDKNKQ